MAKRVRPSMPRSFFASSLKACGSLPSVIEGKSSTGSTESAVLKRPDRTASGASPPLWSNSTVAPSGSLRAISNSVPAGAVHRPSRAICTPGTSSTTAISMSVAVRRRTPPFASISTLDRMGMVLRRSTTLWAWPKALSRIARSTLNFMPPIPSQKRDAGLSIHADAGKAGRAPVGQGGRRPSRAAPDQPRAPSFPAFAAAASRPPRRPGPAPSAPAPGSPRAAPSCGRGCRTYGRSRAASGW